MTNTNLTLFICDLLTAIGAVSVLLGLIVVLLTISLQPADGKNVSAKRFVVLASKHIKTGLMLSILGFILLSMAAVFELIIY